MKVLIADDSSIMRSVIRHNLEKLDIFEISECSDGDSAWVWLQTNKNYNLLFTDINMPGINGLELIHHIKTRDKYKNLEIIVISEYLDDDTKNSLLVDNIKNFIPKPFDLNYFNRIALPLIEKIKQNVYNT